MKNTQVSRRTFLAGSMVSAGVVAAGLSACGSSASSSSASASASASAAVKKGGTITAGLSHATTNFSPIQASSALALPADQHVYEGLYMIDYSNYSTYPALAAAAPKKISDTEYEITLRDGAKFSNGNPVTTADVVKSFEANMAEGKLYVPFLNFIQSITAKDDKTLSLKLNFPYANMESRLACVLVFPKEDDDAKMAKEPVGSGPWMFDGALDGSDGGKLTFKQNPNYNGPKPANADTMEWYVLMDATARTTAMTEKTIMAMEDVPDANADAVKGSGATVDYLDGFCLPFIMYNCIKKPFDDPRVRQAFLYAIDIEKLIANQLAGHAKAAKCFLPESHPNFNQAKNVFKYDPEKAKALLKEAGAENLEITFRVNANWVKDLAPQIAEDFKAIGVTVNMDVNSAFYNDMKGAADSPYTWDVSLAPGDPSCFGNDPDLLMSWWYDNDAWLTERSCWGLATDGKAKELRDMLAGARKETDAKKQQEAWNKCFDFISEQVPLYPILHKQMPTAYDTTKIAGFKPISATGLFFMEASVK